MTVRDRRNRLAPVIEIDRLVKAYGGRRVLDGVDLAVRAGELLALLGPNGAGKTTTVEILEGYRRADGGTARVLGIDPASGGPALRARVGLMLQGGGLDPRSTPIDVLRLYAAFHDGGLDPDALLRLVGLDAVRGTRVRRLSGGERQRLALALALVGAPEVLILDEPTAGMDPEARRLTRELVTNLRADGRAILMTTHDLADVERLADRVAILHGGRILAAGTPTELTGGATPLLRFRLASEPSEEALARLALAIRPPGGAASGAPAAVGPSVVSEAGEGTTAFRLDGVAPSPWLISTVAAWAEAEPLTIAELRSSAVTLEERYLELTGDADAGRAA